MQFSLTILGSSSALPVSGRFPTAQLLNIHERFFLIDCGEGTQMQLRKFKCRLGKIDRLFISHLHGDHVFGLFGLLSSFQLLGRKKAFIIYAHRDIHNLIEFYKKNFGEHLNYEIVINELQSEEAEIIYSDKIIEVLSFPLKHRGPASGFVFREKSSLLNVKKEAVDQYSLGIEQIGKIKQGMDIELEDGSIIPNNQLTYPPWKPRTYAYCSDTAYHPGMLPYINGIDLLYHEATFSAEDESLAIETKHSTSVHAAKIASMAEVKQLLIGHFSSRYKDLNPLIEQAKEIFPETTGVNDGDVFTLERFRLGEE